MMAVAMSVATLATRRRTMVRIARDCKVSKKEMQLVRQKMMVMTMMVVMAMANGNRCVVYHYGCVVFGCITTALVVVMVAMTTAVTR